MNSTAQRGAVWYAGIWWNRCEECGELIPSEQPRDWLDPELSEDEFTRELNALHSPECSVRSTQTEASQ